MEIEQILAVFSETAFPIALVVYLLLRFEKKIDELTMVLSDLRCDLQQK